MPWKIPEEFAHFKRTTIGFPVIMGRRTFESLKRPLERRTNIVLTRGKRKDYANVKFADSMKMALNIASGESDKVFIIGGAEVFENTIPDADELILSFVEGDFHGDAFFPLKFIDNFTQTDEEKQNGFIVKYYSRMNERK